MFTFTLVEYDYWKVLMLSVWTLLTVLLGVIYRYEAMWASKEDRDE